MKNGRDLRAEVRKRLPNEVIPKGVEMTVVEGITAIIEHAEVGTAVIIENYTKLNAKTVKEIRTMLITTRRRIARNTLNGSSHPAWTFLVHPVALWASWIKQPRHKNWAVQEMVFRKQANDTPTIGRVKIAKGVDIVSQPGRTLLCVDKLTPHLIMADAVGKKLHEVLEMPSCGRPWVDDAARQCRITEAFIGKRPQTSEEEYQSSMAKSMGRLPKERPQITIFLIEMAVAVSCDNVPDDAPAAWRAESAPVL